MNTSNTRTDRDYNPLISIITPLYNSEEFILETIESVRSQSYSSWEHLIIDDCSSDRSLSLVKDIASKDPRIRIIENVSNLGPAISRNKGIKAASGQYLTFIDSDDVWHPDFLKKSLAFSQENDYQFVFSSYQRCDVDLKPILKDFIVPSKVDYRAILKSNPISCLTAFMKISDIGKYYMPDIEKRQDFGLWLAILKDVRYAYGNKEVLAQYRMRKDSVSRNKFDALKFQWKVYREIEKLNLIQSLYYIMNWGLRGYLKYRD